jgi:hypothetical protein
VIVARSAPQDVDLAAIVIAVRVATGHRDWPPRKTLLTGEIAQSRKPQRADSASVPSSRPGKPPVQKPGSCPGRRLPRVGRRRRSRTRRDFWRLNLTLRSAGRGKWHTRFEFEPSMNVIPRAGAFTGAPWLCAAAAAAVAAKITIRQTIFPLLTEMVPSKQAGVSCRRLISQHLYTTPTCLARGNARDGESRSRGRPPASRLSLHM